MPQVSRAELLFIYERLYEHYGPQHWWPAEGPFEVMVGAILTQSAAWPNVEKAIVNLKAAGALSPRGLRELPQEELSRLVYPSGYYNAKAAKLKAFAEYLGKGYQDDLERLFAQETGRLREELLAVHGIGEETADSILLYAAGKPVFVIDAYTRRVFSRLGLASGLESYRALQSLFMKHLPLDEQLFNEYHALIVRHAKAQCRKRPECPGCPILGRCTYGRGQMGQVGAPPSLDKRAASHYNARNLVMANHLSRPPPS
jgi:endonuclease-3 related protein